MQNRKRQPLRIDWITREGLESEVLVESHRFLILLVYLYLGRSKLIDGILHQPPARAHAEVFGRYEEHLDFFAGYGHERVNRIVRIPEAVFRMLVSFTVV